VVYAARERCSGDEAYALKRLCSAAAAAHEHNLLATLLPHPNVVAAREIVVSPAGACFLVLQAASCDLKAYMSAHAAVGQRLSVTQVKRALLDVSAGLAHCHRLCVVHRDLKPSNCLIAHEGRVVLTDFGHARLVPRSAICGPCADSPDSIMDATNASCNTSTQGACKWWRQHT